MNTTILWNGKCQCGKISDLFLVTWNYTTENIESNEKCYCGDAAKNLVNINVNVWRGWRKGHSLERNGTQLLCDACLKKYHPQSIKSKKWTINWNICKDCIKKGHPRVKEEELPQSYVPKKKKGSLLKKINLTSFRGIPLPKAEREYANNYLNTFLIGITGRTEEILKAPFNKFWDKARIVPDWMFLPPVVTIKNILMKNKVSRLIFTFLLDKYFLLRYMFGGFLLRRGLGEGFDKYMKDFNSIFGFRKNRKKKLLIVVAMSLVAWILINVFPVVTMIANVIGFVWCIIEAVQWILSE